MIKKSIKRNAYLFASFCFHTLLKMTPFNIMRIILLKLAGVRVSSSSYIGRGVIFDFPWRLSIGKNCHISSGVYLDCRGGTIDIEDCVNISTDAIIYTLSHDIYSRDFKVKFGNIQIESFSWVCARSILLPKSTLEKGSVLAANSVFMGRSNKYTLYRGNPACEVSKLPSFRAKETLID